MSELAASSMLNNRYRLREIIGSGSFGQTWRADDTLLGREVAVKVFADASGTRERYLKEAQAMAQFRDDPGIVQVDDFFAEGGRFCLVMEYLDGQDLGEYVEGRGGLSLRETLDLLRPVFRALEHMHAAGVLHRDVSPDNIRVLGDGTAKLIDFGSVVNLEAPSGTITVKPGYAPFEQYAGGELGPCTDVYALAATVYQCVTGYVPMDSLQRSMEDGLRRPTELGADLTQAEEEALLDGMAIRPDERIQTVGELYLRLTGEPLDESTQPRVTPEAGHDSTRTKAQSPSRGARGHGESQKPRRGRRGRRHSRALRIVILCLVALAVVCVVVLAVGSIGSNPYRASGSTSYVQGSDVSPEMLDTIAGDDGTDSLSFANCHLDDDDIARIAQMTNVKKLTLQRCSGYGSLDPLADMEQLEKLGISEVDGFDGDACFTRTFNNVSDLELSTIRFSSQCGFLERFPNLQTLRIEQQEGATDASFLDRLGSLASVDLSGFDLSGDESTHLAGHASLRRVSVDASGLSTLEWARDCPNLEYLSAGNNAITDLGPLSSCENLTTVRLPDNQVSDLSPLMPSLDGLRTVDFSNNQLSDVSIFSGRHKNLDSLDLSGNQIANADALAGLTGLTTLKLSDNQLTDVGFVGNLLDLQTLALSNNRLADISPVAPCNKLKTCMLNGNQIADIAALGNGFDDLAFLNLSDNQVSSVQPLASCDSLRAVSVAHNRLDGLDGLSDKESLEYLMANGNQIADISALSHDDKLTVVDLGSNQIADASPLANVGSKASGSSPGRLLLDHNGIQSLSWLPTGVSFDLLALNGNPVSDVSRLAELKECPTVMYLQYNDQADYTSYGQFGDSGLDVLCLVDAPSERRNQITGDLGLVGEGAAARAIQANRLRFLSTEEADASLQMAREKIADGVSKFE